MDSMRTLNTSLPASASKKHKPVQHQAGLQQAFKAAAFSVTQLYKAAAAEEGAARAAGYQDAIDELLGFLDSENLGLGDGEGWRVRQWATERLTPDVYGSESDGEEEEVEAPKAGPSSDGAQQPAATHPASSPEKDEPPSKEQQIQSTNTATPSSPTASRQQPNVFHFTGNATTSDTDMTFASPTATNMPPPSLRLNVRSKQSSKRRRSRERTLGQGAGLKRKTSGTFDWADFAGLGRDGHGHGHGGGGGHGGHGGTGSVKRARWGE